MYDYKSMDTTQFLPDQDSDPHNDQPSEQLGDQPDAQLDEHLNEQFDEQLDEQAETQPSDYRSDYHSGFVAVIGRPNVGKSTLLNRLLGQKLAITSPKPQTTRDQLLGILTEENAQILFLDTPGIHKPKHKLGEYMVNVAEETIRNADIVLWLVDINAAPTEEDIAIGGMLQEMHGRQALPHLLLGFNQADRWTQNAAITTERMERYQGLLNWYHYADAPTQPLLTALFSAQQGAGIDTLLTILRQQLPLGPQYYPEDQVTDMQTRFIVEELIREQALNLLEQEVPHGIAVEVDEFTERNAKMTYISAVLYVERQSQKSIVLGEGGRMIKAIGQAARPAIEEVVGTNVYLELWVKVWEKWRKKSGMLRQLGYAVQK